MAIVYLPGRVTMRHGSTVTLAVTRQPRHDSDFHAMKSPDSDGFLFNEIQLILAEKRTSLSTLRTGIAIFALPLSVLSVLVATSRYYDPAKVKVFLVVLGILNGGLVLLGTYLIARALRKIRRYDSLIREIKLKHSAVAEFLD